MMTELGSISTTANYLLVTTHARDTQRVVKTPGWSVMQCQGMISQPILGFLEGGASVGLEQSVDTDDRTHSYQHSLKVS